MAAEAATPARADVVDEVFQERGITEPAPPAVSTLARRQLRRAVPMIAECLREVVVAVLGGLPGPRQDLPVRAADDPGRRFYGAVESTLTNIIFQKLYLAVAIWIPPQSL